MTVVPFKPKGGGNGGEPPHIDSESYLMLVDTLIGFLDLCVKEGDQSQKADKLLDLIRQLERLAERLTPPKGAA